MQDCLTDKLDDIERTGVNNGQQRFDLFGKYLNELPEKPLLTVAEEVKLAKKIEDKHRELTYTLCQYGRKNSKSNGLAILEERLRGVLGKENIHYRKFLELKKRISRSRRNETLSDLYDQVFELLYHSQNGKGLSRGNCELAKKKVPDRFICDTARETAEATRSRHYQAKISDCLSSIEQDKKEFVEANLRLVIRIANTYWGKNLSCLDLIQEGNVNLIMTVDGYKYRRGRRFSAYAAPCIRRTVQRALAGGKTVGLSDVKNIFLQKCKKAAKMLSKQLEREPTREEIAEHMGASTKKVDDVFGTERIVSLYNPTGDEEGTTFMDFIEDKKAGFPENGLIKRDWREVLGSLEPIEAYVIIHRFDLDREGVQTFKQIGEDRGVTGARIRQVQETALKKIRKELGVEVSL